VQQADEPEMQGLRLTGQQLPIAGGPVGTAETGAGKPQMSAEDHNQ